MLRIEDETRGVSEEFCRYGSKEQWLAKLELIEFLG